MSWQIMCQRNKNKMETNIPFGLLYSTIHLEQDDSETER